MGTIYGAGTVCAAGMPPNTPCTIPGGGILMQACDPTIVWTDEELKFEPKCMMCPPDGELCCPSPAGQPGWDARQILLGTKRSITFTNIYAPAAGDYDIVWYYHCANSDTDGYNSATCKGAGGCREAAFTVNGVDDPKLYELPCFPRVSAAEKGWHHIHTWVRTENDSSTVRVPFHLVAGNSNTIKLYARDHDTIDLSAIRVPDGRPGPF
jgi:hypothetical protein